MSTKTITFDTKKLAKRTALLAIIAILFGVGFFVYFSKQSRINELELQLAVKDKTIKELQSKRDENIKYQELSLKIIRYYKDSVYKACIIAKDHGAWNDARWHNYGFLYDCTIYSNGTRSTLNEMFENWDSFTQSEIESIEIMYQ